MLSLSIVGSWLGIKAAEKSLDFVFNKYIHETTELEKELKEAIEHVSNLLSPSYKDLLGSSINYFFTKEEVFNNLMKLLSSFSKEDVAEFSNRYFDVKTLPHGFIQEFINLLKSELQSKVNFAKLLNDKEVYILIKGINEDIHNTSLTSLLSYQQLKEIKEIILKESKEYFDYYDFFDKYKVAALNNLSQVNFIGLGIESHIRKSRKKLEDIFVKPVFLKAFPVELSAESLNHLVISESEENTEEDFLPFDDDYDEQQSINEIFDHKKHVVILGDPGSGKSLCVKYIICSILTDNLLVFNNKDIFGHLPIRIELRKYLAHKRNVSCNFSSYIKHLFESEYNLVITLENVEFILKNKMILVLFDGLDEIFDIGDKINIKNDVENFCFSNENIKAVITSRIIGYSEAKLNESQFNEFQIQEFNDNQINDYVTKWYRFEESDEELREKEVNEFLDKKSRLDNELVKNPLLLSLIVILFRNNLKLPESKLEIYQSCTKTLVEKWDASKNLQIGLDENLLKKKETIIADLAYWQYQTLSSKSIKITYQKAKKTIADCLINKLKIADNLIEALELAESFLQYAENRSIYFDNNFTHKTFLEYYTAYWIYSNYDKKQLSEERDKIISRYIENTFWTIVLELLLNLIDDDQPDNDIIDKIYVEQSANPKALPFLLEVLPTLENISIQQKRNVIQKSMELLINSGKRKRNSSIDKNSNNNLFEILSKSLAQEQSLIPIYFDLYIKLSHNFSSDDQKTKYYTLGYEILNSVTKKDIIDHTYFEDLHKTDNEFKRISLKNPYLWMTSLYYAKTQYNFEYIIEFLINFGKEYFFKDYDPSFASYKLMGVYHYFLRGQIRHEISDFLKNLKILETFGLSIQELEAKYRNRLFVYCTEDELKNILAIYQTTDINQHTKRLLKNIIRNAIKRNRNLLNSLQTQLPAEIITEFKKRG